MLKIGSTKFLQLAILVMALGSNAYAGSEVGEVATSFTVKRLDGTEFNLADYRGEKMVNLVFWATWCPVCRAEIPALKKMQADYGDDVEILAVSVNGSMRPIPEYVQRHELNYPVAFDVSRNILEQYKVKGTPTQVLINKEGVIVYRDSATPSVSSYLAAGE